MSRKGSTGSANTEDARAASPKDIQKQDTPFSLVDSAHPHVEQGNSLGGSMKTRGMAGGDDQGLSPPLLSFSGDEQARVRDVSTGERQATALDAVEATKAVEAAKETKATPRTETKVVTDLSASTLSGKGHDQKSTHGIKEERGGAEPNSAVERGYHLDEVDKFDDNGVSDADFMRTHFEGDGNLEAVLREKLPGKVEDFQVWSQSDPKFWPSS